MSKREMALELDSETDIDRAVEILNRSYHQNNYLAFATILKHPKYLKSLDICSVLLSFIRAKKNGSGQTLLHDLLSIPPEFISAKNSLYKTCEASPGLTAIALLSKNTQQDLVSHLITSNHLVDVNRSMYISTSHMVTEQMSESYSRVLIEIIKYLRGGLPWENVPSGVILISRLFGNAKDKFVTEAAKYDINIPMAESLLQWTSEYKTNPELTKNLLYNKNENVTFAKIIQSTINIKDESNMDSIINLIQNINDNQKLESLWQSIKTRIFKDESLFYYFTNLQSIDSNPIILLCQKNENILTEVLTLMSNSTNIHNLIELPFFDTVFSMGMSNPSIKEQIPHMFDSKLFDGIRMTPENRTYIESIISPKPEETNEQYKHIQNLFASNSHHWYNRYSNVKQELIRESDLKDNIYTSILAAIIMVFSGHTIENASVKNNITEEQVLDAIQDPSIVEQAKKYIQNQTTEPMTDPFKRSMPYNNDAFLKAAFEYLKDNEGLSLQPYRDSKGIWTIGIGHKILSGENFVNGITEDEAYKLFSLDIQNKLSTARRLFKDFDSLPQSVKVALLDGVYRGEHKSHYNTTKLINSGQWSKAAKEYLRNQEYFSSKSKGSKHGVWKRMEENAKRIQDYGKLTET